MKKLLLLCLMLSLSVNFYAQETEKAKTAVKKTANKVADKTEKAAKTTKNAVVKTADKVGDKTSKAAKSVKKESKEVAKDVKKESKEVAAKAETKTKKAATATKAEVKKDANVVAAKAKKATTKVKETNEKAPKVADKVTGTYNGKKVYTGPRGGRYYINANGNKTYIQD